MLTKTSPDLSQSMHVLFFEKPGPLLSHLEQTSVRMTKCEGTGSITKNGVDFFSTDTKESSHNVPCKIACANCRSPLFDEVSVALRVTYLDQSGG